MTDWMRISKPLTFLIDPSVDVLKPQEISNTHSRMMTRDEGEPLNVHNSTTTSARIWNSHDLEIEN